MDIQYADEAAIRDPYRRMLDAWDDAECFSPDGDYGSRFLTPEVALPIGYGHVVYLDERSSEQDKRTVYTLVAQRGDGSWLFVRYQNTPLEYH